MRRTVRILGTLMIAAGVLTLAWALLVWRWQDPFTAAYTHWQQNKLAHAYDRILADYQPGARLDAGDLAAERAAIRREAAAYKRSAHTGQAIGRIVIGRIGLKMVVVNGTDHESLKKGPGRDPR